MDDRPETVEKIWQWSKCCKHLPSICDTSGHDSAWISAGVACSSFYLPSTDLMLCHSVPKGSLIPPMLSCFVCSSLTLFAALCSEGTTEACSYTLMTGKNIEKRDLSLAVKKQIPTGTINILVCLLQPACVGNPCSFQGSRQLSKSKTLLSHSILPPDKPVMLRKTASVKQ